MCDSEDSHQPATSLRCPPEDALGPWLPTKCPCEDSDQPESSLDAHAQSKTYHVALTFTNPLANSADDKLMTLSYIFPEKRI